MMESKSSTVDTKEDGLSYNLPSYLRRLANPEIKTVFISGCGGGFDFVHSLTLIPELKRLKKKIVIGSYSFGHPGKIKNTESFWKEGEVIAVKVTAESIASKLYGPEVHMKNFLDKKYPEDAPHAMYAYYARHFTVPKLKALYQKFIEVHKIDAVILFDGGTDSLVVGDEPGLGDPIEDAVSVATVASLEGLKLKVLISIGFGSDRFNDVSDGCSMRAVAELTQAGGFLGCAAIEPQSPGHKFYTECVDYIYQNQPFRSVATAVINASIEGHFGFEVPKEISIRAKPVHEMYTAVKEGRSELQKNGKMRSVENFPSHESMRCY